MAAASLLGAAWVLKIWRVPLSTPLDYGGDANFYLLMAQGLRRHGSFLTNPDIGFPYGLEAYDLPEGGDILHWTVLRLLLIPFPVGAAIKLFYLATFPVTAITTNLALRRLGARRLIAAAATLVYVFAPYHLQRRSSHLFLSSYFLVPIAVLIAVMIMSEQPPLTRGIRASRWWVLAACLGLGATGTYYAVFAVLLFALGGSAAGITRRTLAPLRSAVYCSATVFVATIVNVSPSLWYWLQNGANATVIRRRPQETEILGIRIQQLFAPRWDHRNPFVQRYAFWALDGPFRSEATQSLAVIGGICLAWLLGRTLLGSIRRDRPNTEETRIIDRLGLLTLGALLIATGSGFGFFLSTFGLRQIRAYNRMSIVIAFCALAAASVAVTAWLDRRAERRAGGGITTRRLALALVVLLAFAAYDQTSWRDSIEATSAEESWNSDRRFFAAMAEAVPEGSAVLQLLTTTFPEYPGRARMGSYDPARGYIHEPGLRWSFGAMYGRVPDLPAGLNEDPTFDVVAYARAEGFRLVLVDRFGFEAGQAEGFEQRLLDRGASAGATSEDERFVWFDVGAG